MSSVSPPDRRRTFRVPTTIGLRLRPQLEVDDWSGDLVKEYEQLGRAAHRFRKETSSVGRQFVDSLLGVLDRLTAHAAEQSTAGGWAPRVVVDATLSGGGLGFLGTTHYELGSELSIEFVFSEQLSSVPFRCDARVVRCEACPEDRWDVGLEFTGLASITQERLVRVLFEIQRKQLRTRRGDA